MPGRSVRLLHANHDVPCVTCRPQTANCDPQRQARRGDVLASAANLSQSARSSGSSLARHAPGMAHALLSPPSRVSGLCGRAQPLGGVRGPKRGSQVREQRGRARARVYLLSPQLPRPACGRGCQPTSSRLESLPGPMWSRPRGGSEWHEVEGGPEGRNLMESDFRSGDAKARLRVCAHTVEVERARDQLV
jgi:hypothetical protein